MSKGPASSRDVCGHVPFEQSVGVSQEAIGAYHVRAELLALAQGARETIEEADLELALTPPTDGSNIKVKAVHRAGLPWVPSHV